MKRHPQIGMPFLLRLTSCIFLSGAKWSPPPNTPYPMILVPYPFDFPPTLEYPIPRILLRVAKIRRFLYIQNRGESNGQKEIGRCIRILSMDGVQRLTQTPWSPIGDGRYCRVFPTTCDSPENPSWENLTGLYYPRTCSMLLAPSHLTGYDVTLDDLNSSGSWVQKTRHPNVILPRVETTKVPLTGFAMLLVWPWGRSLLPLNRRPSLVDITPMPLLVMVPEEGISMRLLHCRNWKLNKLITFYDSNGISIDE